MIVVKNKYRILAFWIGLLTGSNLIYLFPVGNSSSIKPLDLVVIIATLYFIIFDFKNYSICVAKLKGFLIPFLGFIFLSGIPMFIYFPEYVRSYLVGIFFFILHFNTIVLTIRTRDVESVCKGIYFALLINCIYSIICFGFSLIGINISFFSDIFSNHSGVFRVTTTSGFRTTGLFLEPGHMVRYFACTVPLVMANPSRRKMRWSFIMVSLAVCALARSAGFVFVISVVVIVTILLSKYKKIDLWPVSLRQISGIIFIILISIVLSISLSLNDIVQVLDTYINDSLADFSLTSNVSANTYRIDRMMYAIKLLPKYPIIGFGYNISQFVLPKVYDSSVFGTYSYILTLLVETGLGGVFYFLYFLIFSMKIFSIREYKMCVQISVSLAIILIESIITDLNFQNFIAVIIGLGFICIGDKKWNEDRSR